MISIVIPVKDGGQDLERCLSAIRTQRAHDEVELVVIDSGSSDNSVEIVREHGALVREIPPEQFGHGRTRNLGASLAHGEILVFVSQDAVPIDERWLEHLIEPLRFDPEVAGVYGRQIANANARPPERFFLDFLYGPTPRRQRAAEVGALSMQTTLFSNVNAAIRRSVWERFPFVEDIIMSEDQDWCRRVLLEGYCVVYEPQAVVRHSHPYTLGSAFRRFFDSGASADRAYLAGERESSKVLRAQALRYAWQELGWLIRSGQAGWIPYTAVYELTKMSGLIMGANHRRLPLAAKRHLSALPAYWETTDRSGRLM